MANKFRPKTEDIPVEEKPLKADKPKRRFFMSKPKKEFSETKSKEEFFETNPEEKNEEKNAVPEQKEEFSTPKPKKPKNPKSLALKQLQRGFNEIIGMGVLRKVNVKKNWLYFLMVIVMFIVLIYNSLNMQSKKVKIESLKDEIVHANDVLMDVIEEGYVIDDEHDKALSELAKEEGFINKGYMPYIIREDEE